MVNSKNNFNFWRTVGLFISKILNYASKQHRLSLVSLVLLSLLVSKSFVANATESYEQLSIKDVLGLANKKTTERELMAQRYMAKQHESVMALGPVMPRLDASVEARRSSLPSTGLPPFARGPNTPDRYFSSALQWRLDLLGPSINLGDVGSVYGAYLKNNDIAKSEFLLSKEQYFSKVVMLYSRLLISHNSKKVADNTMKYAKSLLTFSQIEFRRGGLSKIDFMRAQSFHEKSVIAAQLAHLNYKDHVESLRLLLDLDASVPISLSGELEQTGPYFETKINSKQESMQVRDLKLKSQLAQYRYRIERSGHFPSIRPFASVVSSFENNFQNPEEAEIQDLGKSERLQYHFGVRLSWTIFDSLTTTSRVRKSYLEQNIVKDQLRQLESQQRTKKRDLIERVEKMKSMFLANIKAAKAEELHFKHLDDDFKHGHSTLSLVLEGEQAWSKAIEQMYQSYAQWVELVGQLKILSGIDLGRIYETK